MPTTVTQGPYAGWMQWDWAVEQQGRFVDVALGPFYFRDEPNHSVRCVIESGRQHTNGGDMLHGGFVMAFADMAYFAIAWRQLADVYAVTLTSNFEFMGAGRAGLAVEAVGHVIRETGKLIFVRALLSQKGEPICATSATLRKLNPRSGPIPHDG